MQQAENPDSDEALRICREEEEPSAGVEGWCYVANTPDQQIGNAALSTAENEPGSVILGEDYRVSFTMGAVSPRINVVRVERFTLEKLKKGADGQLREGPHPGSVGEVDG